MNDKIVFGHRYKFNDYEQHVTHSGILAINNYLLNEELPYLPGWFSRQYIGIQTEDDVGKLHGKFPKRVAQYMKKCHGISLSPKQVSAIGNLAADHTFNVNNLEYDFTNGLMWVGGDFGDDDSCFLDGGARENAPLALENNGAFAIRIYNNKAGVGRAFIVPLREEDCYAVFNGYCGYIYATGKPVVQSDKPTFAMASLFVEHLGYGYGMTPVDLSNYGTPYGCLWINGDGAGYIVGPEDKLDGFGDSYTLTIEVPGETIVMCESCATGISLEYEDDSFECVMPDYDYYCAECFKTLEKAMCAQCGTWWFTDSWGIKLFDGYDDRIICPSCSGREYKHATCGVCEEEFYFDNDDWEARLIDEFGRVICQTCFSECTESVVCDNCMRVTFNRQIVKVGGTGLYNYCPECAHLYSCSKCDTMNHDVEGTYLADGSFICEDCAGGYQLPLVYLGYINERRWPIGNTFVPSEFTILVYQNGGMQ